MSKFCILREDKTTYDTFDKAKAAAYRMAENLNYSDHENDDIIIVEDYDNGGYRECAWFNIRRTANGQTRRVWEQLDDMK